MFSFDDLAIYPLEQFLEHFSMAFGFLSFSFLSKHGAGMEARHSISSLKITYTNTFYDWHGRWRNGLYLPQEEVREHPI
jgi:hypothetical protein